MVECPSCGTTNEGGEKECSTCGEVLPPSRRSAKPKIKLQKRKKTEEVMQVKKSTIYRVAAGAIVGAIVGVAIMLVLFGAPKTTQDCPTHSDTFKFFDWDYVIDFAGRSEGLCSGTLDMTGYGKCGKLSFSYSNPLSADCKGSEDISCNTMCENLVGIYLEDRDSLNL